MTKNTLACPTCNKSKKLNLIKVMGINKEIYVNDCKCLSRTENEANLDRKVKENKAKCNVPYIYSKTFFSNINKNLNTEKCRDYALKFKPLSGEGISLIGNVGTGKTVLLSCMCHSVIGQGYRAYFTPMNEFLNKIIDVYKIKNNTETETNIIKGLLNYDFIAFDDLGREKLTEKKIELFHIIIDKLITNKKSIAFSANSIMIKKLMGIPELEAPLDRLRGLSKENEIFFTGKSLR